MFLLPAEPHRGCDDDSDKKRARKERYQIEPTHCPTHLRSNRSPKQR